VEDEFALSDDPGTILDSLEKVPLIARAALPPAQPGTRAVEEAAYISPYRWRAPQILICNDGELNEGETFHVRAERVVIGRTHGSIVIGHDVAMSASHAEIARVDTGGHFAWVLRDLGSSNGTLVRARAITLRHDTTLQLGSKRFRFELPGGVPTKTSANTDPGTALIDDLAKLSEDSLPALIEKPMPGSDKASARHSLRATRVLLGRPGCGNDIEIDDLCLAGTHAVIKRDHTGTWQLEARPSLNGVWVKVDAIKLTDDCHFQCGEQRFGFRA
jgi:hypothetical protein